MADRIIPPDSRACFPSINEASVRRRDEIRHRAHKKWETRRQMSEALQLQDWLEAEAEFDLEQSMSGMLSNTKRKTAALIDDLPGAKLRADAPVKQAESMLELFFDLSLDLFCIANTVGNFLRINPNFSRLLGFSQDEMRKRPFLEFVHPDDVDATQAAVGRLSRGEPVVRFRNRYGNSCGGYHWIEWNARGMPEDGKIFSVGRDVTDEVNFLKELRSQEQRERAILDNTPAVVFLKDIQGRFLYVNQRYVDLYQSDLETLIGKTDRDIFPEALANQFEQNDRCVIETKETMTAQETALDTKGNLRTYLSVKFPLMNSSGSVDAVAGIATDITKQLSAQEFESQLFLATMFQQKLFPAKAPLMSGLELAGAARPISKLCGDYFDFIMTGPDQIVLAVGDVSGHGIGPALVMVEVRSILRGLLSDGASNDLAKILRKLNGILVEDLLDESFVSLFLAEIDLREQTIRYVGAGHEAFLFPAGQGVVSLHSAGPVLGVIDSTHFEEMPPISINEGDLLLISTDGVTEAMNQGREMYGPLRLAECVNQYGDRSPDEMIQGLFTDVTDFTSGRPFSDDMTVVVAKVGVRRA